MPEFNLERFRYIWRGPWTTGREYNRDDVVQYGGSSWTCTRVHTATTFEADQDYLENVGDTQPTPSWTKMTDGYGFRGNWGPDNAYGIGELVFYGGILYLCTDNHTSDSIFDTDLDASRWETYVSGSAWKGDWDESTRYGIGDLIKYNGIIYRCNTGHTSASIDLGLENDQSKWTIVFSGVEYAGTYTPGVRYRANDLVEYGGSVLRCITGYTAGANLDATKFQTEFHGLKYAGNWDTNTYYAVGDTVVNGGYVFRALTNNVNRSPSDDYTLSPGSPDWEILIKGNNVKGEWQPDTLYKTGDIVIRGGQLYQAQEDTQRDGSTDDYLDNTYWNLILEGQAWKSGWLENIVYFVGDVVTFEGSTWKCNTQHISSYGEDDNPDFPSNFPGDSGSGFEYWDLLILEGPNVGMNQRGDLLTYNYSRGILNDGSTVGPTGVRLDSFGKVLTVGNDDTVAYRNFGDVDRTIFVASDGIDDFDQEDAGSYYKPYRTVGFACRRADDGFDGTTSIYVATGTYKEALPISIPKQTAVIGDELRATVIEACPAETVPASDRGIRIDAIDRISDIIEALVAQTTVTTSSGNTTTQTIVKDTVTVNVSYDPPQYDADENEIYESSYTEDQPIASSVEAAQEFQTLIANTISKINFIANSGPTDPVIRGSLDKITDENFINALRIFNANKTFILDEVMAFLAASPWAGQYDVHEYRTFIHEYILLLAKDYEYSSNYEVVLAGRRYANSITGSSLEDMFYCRDTTGLRNCTVKGLTGSLNPPVSFEVYQRPTGGSYVSLDPGWGVDDSRQWIMNRSPYIQNVTTFGTACVGQKIDGALHNGGNKSITSNDFTQVLSDGIGAWVTNNGRAELVSVFTYYAQIGYFAEAGGIIRATNGNCSYGDIGALAQGNDPNETPQSATLNNRDNQAQVANAFAGERNDEVFIFEMENAGQEYTEASYNIVASGTGVEVVQEDFRDKAIFESRILRAEDSSLEGGFGFFLTGNNAQEGDTTTITVASSSEFTKEEVLGLRIIITSGEGTGQYGYIQDYNPLQKLITVYRESDNQPGWDHLVPGWPITEVLTTSTAYRIEPRPVFSEPTFSAEVQSAPISVTWQDITYGETFQSFLAIQGTGNKNGTLEGDAVAEDAAFNVTKDGREYTVSLSSSGQGYAVGDIITISGSQVGGFDGQNDIKIYVEATTDDSTDSITQFRYEGLGQSGYYIALPNSGQVATISLDGSEWNNIVLPETGSWNSIAAGGTAFVLVKSGTNVFYSRNAEDWTTSTLPVNQNWTKVNYGNGVFVAISEESNDAAYSTNNGATWSSVTLPTVGDSTQSVWADIAYGGNKWVAVGRSNSAVAIGDYNAETDTWTWTQSSLDTAEDSTQADWIAVEHGNNRFLAISTQGDVRYSWDGVTWYGAIMPSQDGSTAFNWRSVKYGNGIFFAVCDAEGVSIGDDAPPVGGRTNYAATSVDGIVWESRTLASSLKWKAITYGRPENIEESITDIDPYWIAVANELTGVTNRIRAGARAQGRAIVEGQRISEIRMWDVGSGYISAPTYEIIDANQTSDAFIDLRVGNGVLGQPTFTGRGKSYKSSTTTVEIIGNGFADIYPEGRFITISGLTRLPGPGAQLRFSPVTAESQIHRAVTIELLRTEVDGGLTAKIRISPTFNKELTYDHDTTLEIRERYSQCRITGHDFLDIGTGNFEETNYPTLYATGDYFDAPENEVVELDGGRVFYTSTDQDGNFRVGELFAVEQATGIVTISADFFDLDGLTELALGGIRVGGSGTVIREFSKDPFFTEDSNNIVPTQRAIKAYLTNRLNVGGADLLTASFVAGVVRVGPSQIATTTGQQLVFPVQVDFSGSGASINGSILAQTVFFNSFNDIV